MIKRFLNFLIEYIFVFYPEWIIKEVKMKLNLLEANK